MSKRSLEELELAEREAYRIYDEEDTILFRKLMGGENSKIILYRITDVESKLAVWKKSIKSVKKSLRGWEDTLRARKGRLKDRKKRELLEEPVSEKETEEEMKLRYNKECRDVLRHKEDKLEESKEENK